MELENKIEQLEKSVEVNKYAWYINRFYFVHAEGPDQGRFYKVFILFKFRLKYIIIEVCKSPRWSRKTTIREFK